MPISIDGVNLIITLPSATPIIDVETDLYSEWKKWALLDDNLGVEQAFRTVAGDPLTPGIDVGAYFFLQNDVGWRIRPAEEDATVLFTGNLAPEDSTLDMTVPTLGAFTVLIQGLQPVTQAVDTILTLQQDSSFQGCVYIDTFGSTAGTEYPKGTASEPVNNLADAVTIANRIGVRCLKLIGVLTLDRTFQFWTINGIGAVAEIDINGQDVSGTRFEACGVYGICGALSQRVVIDLGRISPAGLVDYVGIISRSVFDGNLSLVAGDTSIIQCSSNIVGTSTPIIDAQNADVNLSVRQWIGGYELRNFSLPTCVASFDLIPGHLILDSTVTDGIIVLRGLGKLTNNAGLGITLDDKGFVDARDVHFAGDAAIHIDSISGNDANDGRAGSPVQTAAAAKILADGLGIAVYHFKGSITLTSDHDRWAFIGDSAQFNDVLNLNNQSIDESRTQGCRLSGDATESNIEALFCEIDNPGNLHGIFRQCGLLNNFKVEATTPQTYIFHHCYSGVGGSGRPTLDFTNVAVTHNVQLRNYVGGISVINMVQGNLSIDAKPGTVDLQDTMVGGDAVIRGDGLFINNAGPGVNITDGFQNWTDFNLMNELLAGNVDVSLDDQTVTVFKKGSTTIPIATFSMSTDGRIRRRLT